MKLISLKNNKHSLLKNLTNQKNDTIFGKTHVIKKNNKHSLSKNLTNQKDDTIFGKVYVFKRKT